MSDKVSIDGLGNGEGNGGGKESAADSGQAVFLESTAKRILDESPTLRKGYARWKHLGPKALLIQRNELRKTHQTGMACFVIWECEIEGISEQGGIPNELLQLLL